MHIESLQLRDYRVFNAFSVRLDPELLCIVGLNGAGKSSLLAAAGAALSAFLHDSGCLANPAAPILAKDIARGKAECVLQSVIEADSTVFYQTLTARTDAGQIRMQTAYDGPHPADWGAARRAVGDNAPPLFLYYYGARNLSGKELGQWLREAAPTDVQAVQLALAAVTGFDGLSYDTEAGEPILRKNNRHLGMSQLSDGEKCLICLTTDIARHMVQRGPGVILIDEIELHLHPGWQRRILPELRRAFATCQFLVTTHSPQVLGEIEPERILVLDEDPDTGEPVSFAPRMSYGLDSGLILESLMDAPARSTVVEQLSREMFQAIDQKQYDAARKLMERLRRMTGGDIPDVTRAQALLEMFGD